MWSGPLATDTTTLTRLFSRIEGSGERVRGTWLSSDGGRPAVGATVRRSSTSSGGGAHGKADLAQPGRQPLIQDEEGRLLQGLRVTIGHASEPRQGLKANEDVTADGHQQAFHRLPSFRRGAAWVRHFAVRLRLCDVPVVPMARHLRARQPSGSVAAWDPGRVTVPYHPSVSSSQSGLSPRVGDAAPGGWRTIDDVMSSYLDAHPGVAHRWLLVQTLATSVMRRQLLATLGVQPGWRALDVGTGFGPVPMELAAMAPVDAVGVDVDEVTLRAADSMRRDVAGRGGFLPGAQVSFATGDAYKLEQSDASVDLVTARFVFQHLSDQAAAAVRTGPGGETRRSGLSGRCR